MPEMKTLTVGGVTFKIADADAVKYTPQTPNATEQGQAQKNINVKNVTVLVSDIEGGHRLTFVDANGTHNVDLMDGTNGKDGTSVTVASVDESTDDSGSNVVTFSDGKILTVKNGSKGSGGKDGTNGVSATHSWNGTVLTVASASGTSSADLKGTKGDAGADGYTPVRGTDYWTEADQEAIVQQVIAALGTPVFGAVDENNNIILTGELADGTYTIKYEDAEGNVTEIGTIEVGGMGDSGSIELVWADNVKLDKNTGAESTANGEYAASQHIELVDGYTYTFSQTVYGGVNICYYDANGTGLGYELLWDGVDDVKTRALTPKAGAATFRVRLYYGLNTTIEEAKDRYSLTYEKTA